MEQIRNQLDKAQYDWADPSYIMEIANALAWRAAVTAFAMAFGFSGAIVIVIIQSMPQTFDWITIMCFSLLISSSVYGLIYWLKGIAVVNVVAPFLVPDTRPKQRDIDEEIDEAEEYEDEEPLSDFVDRGEGLLVRRGSISDTITNPPHPARSGVKPPQYPGVRRVERGRDNGGVGEILDDVAEELNF